LRSALVGSLCLKQPVNIKHSTCDDGLTTHLIICQFSNSFDVHIWVCDESFEFRKLWGVVISDELWAGKKRPSHYT